MSATIEQIATTAAARAARAQSYTDALRVQVVAVVDAAAAKYGSGPERRAAMYEVAAGLVLEAWKRDLPHLYAGYRREVAGE